MIHDQEFPEADQYWHAAHDRYFEDAELHAKVETVVQVLKAKGAIARHPSDGEERRTESFVRLAAQIACVIPGPGERKRMAVITPSDHYFREWQRTHPEYEGVAITSVQKARGQLFDSYVCYDPALRMPPGEVGPRVMAVRSALKPR